MVLCLKTRESRSLPGLLRTIPLHAFAALSSAAFPFGHKAEAIAAGWSSPVARQAHNLKVTGSNPVPATKTKPVGSVTQARFGGLFRVQARSGSAGGRTVVIVAGCAYDDGVVALRGAIPMRTACALVLFALFAATPASAQKIDVSTIKCEEFVKSGKDISATC